MRLTPFYVSVLFLGAFARVLMHLAVDPVNNRGKIEAHPTWSPFPAIAYPEMNADWGMCECRGSAAYPLGLSQISVS
jgi:hypothetical protein